MIEFLDANALTISLWILQKKKKKLSLRKNNSEKPPNNLISNLMPLSTKT